MNLPIVAPPNGETGRHPVLKEHPRLIGSRERLQRLARERADAYQRVVRVARQAKSDEHSEMISMALVTAIEQDRLDRAEIQPVALAVRSGGLLKGHDPFSHFQISSCQQRQWLHTDPAHAFIDSLVLNPFQARDPNLDQVREMAGWFARSYRTSAAIQYFPFIGRCPGYPVLPVTLGRHWPQPVVWTASSTSQPMPGVVYAEKLGVRIRARCSGIIMLDADTFATQESAIEFANDPDRRIIRCHVK